LRVQNQLFKNWRIFVLAKTCRFPEVGDKSDLIWVTAKVSLKNRFTQFLTNVLSAELNRRLKDDQKSVSLYLPVTFLWYAKKSAA